MSEKLRVAQVYTEFETKGLAETAGGINKLKDQISGLKKLAAGFIGGFTLKTIASEFVSAARSAEDYRTSIRAVSASVEEADATFERIKNWAAVNPIDTDEAIGAFVRLRTASVQNSEEALKAVADVATVMHRDVRDVASAVVSMETESLRNLGIILDQSGKKAVMTSNGIRLEVNKDVNSIRAGIIELMQKAFGGGMETAKTTFSGALSTMGGMWQEFKTDIMGEGKGSGPFQQLKDEINDVNSAWENFVKTDDYKELIQEIQGGLVSGIRLAESAVIAFGNGFKYAKEHAELLKTILYTIISYKASLAAVSIAQAALGSQTMQLVSLLPAALKSLKDFVAWVQLAGVAIGPAGWIAAAVSAGVLLTMVSQMREAEKQAKITADAIESLDEEFKDADASTLKEELNRVEKKLLKVSQAAITAQQEILNLTRQKLNDGEGYVSNMTGEAVLSPAAAAELKAKEALVQKLSAEQKALEARSKELAKRYDSKYSEEKLVKAAGRTISSPKANIGSSSKGKSDAEKLVEAIRAQIKYLNADGESFLPVLQKWIAKTKVLSSDWKTLKDLETEIISKAEDTDPNGPVRLMERLKETKERMVSLREESERAKQAFYDVFDWQYDNGLITEAEHTDALRENFERLREEYVASGLAIENYQQWPEKLKAAFSALSSALSGEAQTAFEELKHQLDSSKLTTEQFKVKVEELIATTDNPQAKKNLEAWFNAWADGADKAAGKVIDLTEETRKWVQDFQSGIADAIVNGEGLADTIRNITKELAKMAVKVALFGNNGTSGLLGGFITKLFGFHSGGIVGGTPTFERGISIPKFHTGGIVGLDEQLIIAKRGEGVFTPEQMKAMGSSGGNTYITNVTAKVENNGSGSMNQQQAEHLGQQLNEAVSIKVAEELYKYQRQGLLRTA